MALWDPIPRCYLGKIWPYWPIFCGSIQVKDSLSSLRPLFARTWPTWSWSPVPMACRTWKRICSTCTKELVKRMRESCSSSPTIRLRMRSSSFSSTICWLRVAWGHRLSFQLFGGRSTVYVQVCTLYDIIERERGRGREIFLELWTDQLKLHIVSSVWIKRIQTISNMMSNAAATLFIFTFFLWCISVDSIYIYIPSLYIYIWLSRATKK